MREMDEAVMAMAGPEKRSHRITEKDRRMTAYPRSGTRGGFVFLAGWR